MQKLIDGESGGPEMVGVKTYPYSRLQYEYLDDFQSLVATTITHPFMATTAFNRASVPHDLLYGSNFDDDRLGAEKKWKSEYRRSYMPKSHVQSKRAPSSGVRSEQVRARGQDRSLVHHSLVHHRRRPPMIPPRVAPLHTHAPRCHRA